ncbi:MAG: Verru_Chthon cassette protein B [Chthoniobacteraceae bacterium]
MHPVSKSFGLRKCAQPSTLHRSGIAGCAVARRAFSLVEVVLALGIISVSLLAVMGLMPVGLKTMREAMDATVESQILQKINAEASLTPFSQLAANFAGKTFYYDESGLFLSNSPATAPSATRYWVTTDVTNPIYPGSSNAAVSNNLSALSILIVSAASSGATNKVSHVCNVQIPNSGN